MIITEPGEYITRDGTRVTIREISGPSSWPCKGSLWSMFRGNYVPRGYGIWQANGRYTAGGEHPLDIVEAA